MHKHRKTRTGRTSRVLAVAATIVAVLAVGLSTANAAGLIGSPGVQDNSLKSVDIHNTDENGIGVKLEDTSKNMQDRLNQVPILRNDLDTNGDVDDEQTARLDALEAGNVTATAATALTQRPDSGVHGDWAHDAFTRTATVTREGAVDTSNCGGGVAHCWYYTGTITDNGTFTTLEGALSPEAGDAINGIVSGGFVGGTDVEFYSTSGNPLASRVPATEEGVVNTTGNWVKLFFPAAAQFSAVDLLNWSWTYTAPATCEQWVNAFDGNTGDIAGVNAC